MRIAVTGATGNIGTALLRRLARDRDPEVVGLARRLPEASPAPGLERGVGGAFNLAAGLGGSSTGRLPSMR